MKVRWIILFAGVLALVVGITGLFTPVNAGPANVSCGSAMMPDLAAARAATEHGGANIPVPDLGPGIPEPARHDAVIINSDYVSLCRQNLADRRMWTITLAAVGAVATLGALAAAARVHRRRSDTGSPERR